MSDAAPSAPSCACEEPTGTSRRRFLGRMLATGALAAASPAVASRYAFAAGPYAGDTLVVLSLRGGFDGLSAIVPAGDPNYYTARPGIGVPQAALTMLDSTFGLHPALAPLLPLWQAGKFGAVHAVGQQSPTRSHFQAMEEMERAAPGTSLRTGWLDRTLGLRGAGTAFQAVQMGSGSVSSAFAGPAPELALPSVDDFQVSAAWDATEAARWDTALRALHTGAPAVVAAPARATLAAAGTTRRLKAAGYQPAVSYPSTDLGKALQDVARLVKANVGLQVAAVDYGDWDMHTGLGGPDDGRMQRQLAGLAAALAAFAADLGSALDNVTVVTLSEFGRRVEENASGGLDHGHGNAVLLMGGGVVGGRVHGAWPTLAPDRLDDGDLAGTTDYRLLLGEILTQRCGAGSLGSIFPGLGGTPLGIVRPR